MNQLLNEIDGLGLVVILKLAAEPLQEVFKLSDETSLRVGPIGLIHLGRRRQLLKIKEEVNNPLGQALQLSLLSLLGLIGDIREAHHKLGELREEVGVHLPGEGNGGGIGLVRIEDNLGVGDAERLKCCNLPVGGLFIRGELQGLYFDHCGHHAAAVNLLHLD